MPSDEAKMVKKEEEEDAADEKSLSSMLASRKRKPTIVKVNKEEPKDEYDDFQKPLRKAASGSKIKKEHNAVDDDYHKPITKKNSSISTKEMQKKRGKREEKKAEAEAEQNGKNKERKGRKVYDFPGQKRDPPEERDPLRIFYETLYKQVPKSEMAQFWMMESGLLSFDEAKKVLEKKQKRNKFSSPTKAISAVKRTTEAVTVKRKSPSSLVSSNRKKMIDSKVVIKQSKKRKVDDGSSESEDDNGSSESEDNNGRSESEDDSDDDFSIKKPAKKQKAK